ncbi:thiamine-phosphate kinase [Roseibium sp.]|uniref:thiamine-phosphate kinase n=1 Tax=Roseibium sp. TaxID=1936156 RepID=UPI003A97DEAE
MAGETPQQTEDGRPGEFDLIRRFFAPLASDPGSLGLTDDASVYKPRPGFELVLTKDMLAADVHFFADDPPEAIAAKALRVNLSDLAAKGAEPRAYLLGLALPDDWQADWLERFCCGLSGDQAAFGITLVGGDTIRSGNGLQLSITAIGEVPEGTAVRRKGAAPGDILYVSGTIGDAAAGLKDRLDPDFKRRMGFSSEEERHILDRYLLPRPRVKLAAAIRAHASAAMDVSDGLLADAAHLARSSCVDLEIELDRVPLSDAMKTIAAKDGKIFAACLNGGDDYEILSAVPESASDAFERAASEAGCDVTAIGRVVAGEGRVVPHSTSGRLSNSHFPGFRHF